MSECETCKGSGEMPTELPVGGWEKCHDCGGTGIENPQSWSLPPEPGPEEEMFNTRAEGVWDPQTKQVVLVTDLPRTWSLPDEPGPEVKAVRTDDGRMFYRNTFGYWYSHRNGSGYDGLYPWLSILQENGLLTDATGELEK